MRIYNRPFGATILRSYNKPMNIMFDPAKGAANIAKHGVSLRSERRCSPGVTARHCGRRCARAAATALLSHRGHRSLRGGTRSDRCYRRAARRYAYGDPASARPSREGLIPAVSARAFPAATGAMS